MTTETERELLAHLERASNRLNFNYTAEGDAQSAMKKAAEFIAALTQRDEWEQIASYHMNRAAILERQLDEARAQAKILDHKWLDPGCVEHGCKSLLPRALADQIAKLQPPDDPHSDAWMLGFCRARKTAADLIKERLGPDNYPVMQTADEARAQALEDAARVAISYEPRRGYPRNHHQASVDIAAAIRALKEETPRKRPAYEQGSDKEG
jgi:hypothetical protein